MLCLGGFHISVPSEDEATRIIHTAIDNGMPVAVVAAAGEDLRHDAAMHVRQPVVPALKLVGQPLMVDAELVEQGGGASAWRHGGLS